MAVEIKSTYIGKLSVKNIHGPSGSEVTTTAPLDNGGTGEFFSPTDLLAASLGSCMLTIMGKVAERNGIDFSGASVSVEKHMTDKPRRVQKLVVGFSLSWEYSENDRRKIEAAAKTCPVAHSIHPDIEVDISFRYEK
ncbi:MAG: OsmC family protein [bacterium]|nr:OsmC family protein [bacterium]